MTSTLTGPDVGALLGTLAPTASGFVNASKGARLYFELYGAGPKTLVYINGANGKIPFAGHIVQRMVRLGYRVLLHEARGIGRSTCRPGRQTTKLLARDCLAVVDTVLGADSRFYLMGLSMGGMVAQELMHRLVVTRQTPRLLAAFLVVTTGGERWRPRPLRRARHVRRTVLPQTSYKDQADFESRFPPCLRWVHSAKWLDAPTPLAEPATRGSGCVTHGSNQPKPAKAGEDKPPSVKGVVPSGDHFPVTGQPGSPDYSDQKAMPPPATAEDLVKTSLVESRVPAVEQHDQKMPTPPLAQPAPPPPPESQPTGTQSQLQTPPPASALPVPPPAPPPAPPPPPPPPPPPVEQQPEVPGPENADVQATDAAGQHGGSTRGDRMLALWLAHWRQMAALHADEMDGVLWHMTAHVSHFLGTRRAAAIRAAGFKVGMGIATGDQVHPPAVQHALAASLGAEEYVIGEGHCDCAFFEGVSLLAAGALATFGDSRV